MLVTPIFRSYTSEKESAKKKKRIGQTRPQSRKWSNQNCTPREKLHTHTEYLLAKDLWKKAIFSGIVIAKPKLKWTQKIKDGLNWKVEYLIWNLNEFQMKQTYYVGERRFRDGSKSFPLYSWKDENGI